MLVLSGWEGKRMLLNTDAHPRPSENWTRTQTQNFAGSEYVQPHHTFEAEGHLLGAHGAGGKECASNSEAGHW